MQYLWQFYLLIAVVFVQGVLLLRWGKFGKWAFAALCFAELAFLAGFRSWDIGNDTGRYVQTFVLSLHYPELLKSHMEAGYLWYNRFLAHFTSNPQMLLLTTSIFIVWAWTRFFYKYSVSLLMSMILFVALEFSTVLTMVRQEIAMCMIFLAVPFIIQRKFILFLLVVWLASTVHSSAVLALGLYFLYPLPFKMKYVSWVLVGTALAFVLLPLILDNVTSIMGRYDGYIGNRLLGEETKVASIVKFGIQSVVAGFLLFSYHYVFNKEDALSSPVALPFLAWCSVVAACLQFLSIRGTVLERLVGYFSAFNFISIPYFVRCYPRKVRLWVIFGILCCFILYKSIVFVYRPEWNHVLPFEFCF